MRLNLIATVLAVGSSGWAADFSLAIGNSVAVALADLTNEEAIAYVQNRLRRMGVERALARAGAREGDVVRIGEVELDYEEGL